MDLDNKVSRIDDELKLLKNEIKQVLLEIQEHALNAQNPFAGTFQTAPAVQRSEIQDRVAADTPATASASEPVPTPAPPQYPVAPQGPAPGPYWPQPAPASGAVGPQVIGPAYQTQQPYQAQQPPEPPVESPPPVQASGRADGTSVSAGRPSKPPTPATESPTIPEPPVESPLLVQASGRDDGQHSEPEEAVAQGEPYSQFPGPKAVARLDSSDRPTVPESPAKHSATPEGERRTSTAAPVSKQESPDYTDLVMISGLAQWTDRVLRKGGREYLESLLDVTEMTGRTSSGLKEIVLAFVDLLDKKDSTTRISAKEMVSLLAQLDAIMGIRSSTDARLHALLLQEDLEVFPLIQP